MKISNLVIKENFKDIFKQNQRFKAYLIYTRFKINKTFKQEHD